ncbi:hypothetical protein M9H77_10530 [Catharanthus roseus]|uniref:Uncharacterized protein n=1 Tax=Catharanthus roseus TaxID=4058 RepID=A0ACC0BBZ9_CATRO|nr:hypothetical protein M9H77_10530 [Catharanthus roseus]
MDDDFNSFFPLQDDDDAFLFQYTVPTTTVSQQQQNVKQDLLILPGSAPSLVLENNNEKKEKNSAAEEEGSIGKQKRIVHRDIERQRRQEMANLYASLRTLLPLEYIKGKRSLSDQINEAIKYIKYKEKNIEQLNSKKDKMKNFFDGNDNIAEGKVGNTSKSSSCSPVDISIRPCSHGGFEILISNQIGEERCLLSSVLEVLIEESLTIVNCFCAKVNDKFIQTIQTEAIHNTGFDALNLSRKLSQRIKAPINFKCISSN